MIIPLIHIIGLPGAGKTTLAERLSEHFNYIPIHNIGMYREGNPQTGRGEASAWVNLYFALSMEDWESCILETTGLNFREQFLNDLILVENPILKIKLNARREILYKRIKKKKKSEQGGNWLFNDAYPDKKTFVRKLFSAFSSLPATIEIDTTKLTAYQVYKKALEELKLYVRKEYNEK